MEVHDRYLGLSTIVGKSKRQIFSKVRDKVWKKLKNWKEKALSARKKEVLIKVIIQAIPSYIISCFSLPINLCKEIEFIIRKFWWGQKEEE